LKMRGTPVASRRYADVGGWLDVGWREVGIVRLVWAEQQLPPYQY